MVVAKELRQEVSSKENADALFFRTAGLTRSTNLTDHSTIIAFAIFVRGRRKKSSDRRLVRKKTLMRFSFEQQVWNGAQT